jgi:hypothetical protein
MKKNSVLLALALVLGLGLFFSGCGSDDNKSKKVTPPTDVLELRTNLSISNYTYSLSSGTIIGFGAGVIKDGHGIVLEAGDIDWTYEGPDVGIIEETPGYPDQARLTPNGTKGTITVKADYQGISATVTIHIVD